MIRLNIKTPLYKAAMKYISEAAGIAGKKRGTGRGTEGSLRRPSDLIVMICGMALAMGLGILLPVKASNASVLSSVAVTPAYKTIMVGQTQPFTATGTFLDGSSGVLSASMISAGGFHACVLISGGSVECWGDNTYGQLGDGTNTNSRVPVLVSGISNAVAISAGDSHTCALLADGTVQCWGDNDDGQLGNTNTYPTYPSAIPVPVKGLSGPAVAISASRAFTCALLSGGAVQCWGFNLNGQIGNGSAPYDSLTPVLVSGLSGPAVAISAGNAHACALLSGGTVQCWGDDMWRELGDGAPASSSSTAAPPVSGLSGPAVAISAGSYHTCALISDGTVQCWGMGGNGQLGNGLTPGYSSTPVTASISGVTAISAGDFFTCAVISSGAEKCWGDNTNGELGGGTTGGYSATPPSVPAINSGAVAISAGNSGSAFTCTILSGGTVVCWGDNFYGQLGIGATGNSYNTPKTVFGIGPITAVSAGRYITCAVIYGSNAECWGDNDNGALGNGTITSSTTPGVVHPFGPPIAISAGGYHVCAIMYGGGVVCWGGNNVGQMGNGTVSATEPYAVSTPVSVSGLSGVTAISAGGYHTCALIPDPPVVTPGGLTVFVPGGFVQCWGDNSSGQLGGGNTVSYSASPVLSGVNPATAISAGWTHTCALMLDGTVQCWGDNSSGQLGIGSQNPSPYNVYNGPQVVSGLSGTAVAISAGWTHTCALISDGTVQCWGNNSSGQLGNGTTNNLPSPTKVPGLSGVSAISAGGSQTCALISGGTVQCWGDTSQGKFTTPKIVSGITNAEAISAGSDQTCAIISGGTLECWGGNAYGDLGIGNQTPSITPVVPKTGPPLTLLWNSSDTSVATISANGIASGLSPGTVTITATSTGGISGSATLTVIAPCTTDCPDLLVNALIATPSGTTLSVTDVEQNIGKTAAAEFSVAFYLSATTAPNPQSDILIGTRTISGLAGGGAINTKTTKFTIPPTMPIGNYYLCAITDFGDAIPETNETNNTKCSGGTYAVSPDLQVSLLSGLLSGVSLYVSDTEINPGGQPAGAFTVSYFLSAGTTPNPATDTLVGTRSLTGLAGGSSTNSVTTKFTVPPSMPMGTYYLCAITDSGGVVTELNEANNTKCTAGTYTIGPDLLVNSISGPLSGTNLYVSDTEQNIGNQPAGGFSVAFYLSATTTPNPATDTFVGTRILTSLAGGSATNSWTTTFTVPVSMPMGTYYLCAITDSAGLVTELNEANNTKCTAGTYTIGPDLLVNSIASFLSGTKLYVSDTEQNIGNQPAGGFSVAFYLSATTTPNPATDTLVGTRILTSLAGGGATSSATTTFTVPVSMPVGTYYLCAITDSAGLVTELNEANNTKCTAGTYTIGPDLLFYGLSGSLSGNTFYVSDTVQNTGNQPAGAFTISYYLSSDTIYGPGDILLGSRNLSGLSGGSATNSKSPTFTIPTGTPSGSYYIIAVADSGSTVTETNEGNNTKATAGTFIIP